MCRSERAGYSASRWNRDPRSEILEHMVSFACRLHCKFQTNGAFGPTPKHASKQTRTIIHAYTHRFSYTLTHTCLRTTSTVPMNARKMAAMSNFRKVSSFIIPCMLLCNDNEQPKKAQPVPAPHSFLFCFHFLFLLSNICLPPV